MTNHYALKEGFVDVSLCENGMCRVIPKGRDFAVYNTGSTVIIKNIGDPRVIEVDDDVIEQYSITKEIFAELISITLAEWNDTHTLIQEAARMV